MSFQSTEMEYASLGDYIRQSRISQEIDLLKVAEETKISSKSLHAIEENDFAALPAEAFTRGLYILYAKMLSLDPEKVIQMYTQERSQQGRSGNSSVLRKHKLNREVGNMAERPTFMPVSFLSLVLLLSLLFGGFLCWYFSWNPATYLSQKLRSLEEPLQIEQVSAGRTAPGTKEYDLIIAKLQKLQPKQPDVYDVSELLQ